MTQDLTFKSTWFKICFINKG